MGTDIHLYVERLEADGKWHVVPPPSAGVNGIRGKHRETLYTCDGQYVGDEHIACTGKTCAVCAGSGHDLRWFGDRNYLLFGRLADVRGDGPPIAPPRGIPHDASETVHEWHFWDHTPSWFTVIELMRQDWSMPALARFQAFIYEDLLPLGPPDRVRIVFGFDS